MFNAKCATCFDRSVSIHQASANNEEKVYICHIPLNNFFFGGGATSISGPRPPNCRGFTITPRHTTLGRTSLDE